MISANQWKVMINPERRGQLATILTFTTRVEACEAMWAAQREGKKASLRGYQV